MYVYDSRFDTIQVRKPYAMVVNQISVALDNLVQSMQTFINLLPSSLPDLILDDVNLTQQANYWMDRFHLRLVDEDVYQMQVIYLPSFYLNFHNFIEIYMRLP